MILRPEGHRALPVVALTVPADPPIAAAHHRSRAGEPPTQTGDSRCGHGVERGSGTLLIMLVVVIMLVLAASFAVVGRYLVAGQRARAAADLAALAAAQTYGTGGDGCAAARRLAAENRQRLTDCVTVGDQWDFVITVTITTAVPIRSPILPDKIILESHAGPVR